MGGSERPDERLPRARSPWRGVFVAYLNTSVVLAISRVLLDVWINHRFASHTVTPTVNNLMGLLYPESLIAGYTRVGAM